MSSFFFLFYITLYSLEALVIVIEAGWKNVTQIETNSH